METCQHNEGIHKPLTFSQRHINRKVTALHIKTGMGLGYSITPLSFSTGLYTVRKSNGTDTNRKETRGITYLC